jgi:uncharacterized membrane protein YdjX (TVP38/TMEM64 family)
MSAPEVARVPAALEVPEAAVPEPRVGRKLLLLAVVLAALLAVYLSPLHELLLPQGLAPLREKLALAGVFGPLLFGLGTALLVAVGAPRLWFAAAGGLLFGWLGGFLLAQAGTTLGCVLNFAWGRWLARDLVARRQAPRLQRLLAVLARAPVATNIAVRLCPVGNCFAFNLLLAVTSVSTFDFVLGTFVGTLPETLVYALFGGSAENGSLRLLLAGGALMAAMTAVSLVIARSTRRR